MEAHGKEEVGRFFQGLAATWADFGVETDDYVASGDRLNGTTTGYGFVHSWTVADSACVLSRRPRPPARATKSLSPPYGWSKGHRGRIPAEVGGAY